jgi:hypothetical protein
MFSRDSPIKTRYAARQANQICALDGEGLGLISHGINCIGAMMLQFYSASRVEHLPARNACCSRGFTPVITYSGLQARLMPPVATRGRRAPKHLYNEHFHKISLQLT